MCCWGKQSDNRSWTEHNQRLTKADICFWICDVLNAMVFLDQEKFHIKVTYWSALVWFSVGKRQQCHGGKFSVQVHYQSLSVRHLTFCVMLSTESTTCHYVATSKSMCSVTSPISLTDNISIVDGPYSHDLVCACLVWRAVLPLLVKKQTSAAHATHTLVMYVAHTFPYWPSGLKTMLCAISWLLFVKPRSCTGGSYNVM